MADFFSARAGKAIEEKHRDAEWILDTGKVPHRWYEDSLSRTRRRSQAKDCEKARSQARELCVKRLDDLMKYFSIWNPERYLT